MIVLVCLNTSFGILNIEVEFFQFLQNQTIDRNSVKSYDYPAVKRDSFISLAPFMTVNLL